MPGQNEVEKYPPGFHSNVRFGDREEGYDDGPSDARIGPQLGYMQDSLSKLTSLIESLGEKVSPILLPEDSVNVNMPITASPPRKPASEVSNMIDDLNGQITQLQGMVVRIAERVQL